MNQRFWISLPAALLATLGTTFSSYAQPQTAIDSHSEALTQAEISIKTPKVELGTSESDQNKGYGKRKRSSSGSGSGMASWYGAGPGYTAAHRSLPFGTRVRVTNLNNNRSVVVKINDRGPFIAGRVIDVSGAAASALGIIDSGVAPVSIEVLGS
jgi:rare lipoprotein A (peptidoglycan hydrolase)